MWSIRPFSCFPLIEVTKSPTLTPDSIKLALFASRQLTIKLFPLSRKESRHGQSPHLMLSPWFHKVKKKTKKNSDLFVNVLLRRRLSNWGVAEPTNLFIYLENIVLFSLWRAANAKIYFFAFFTNLTVTLLDRWKSLGFDLMNLVRLPETKREKTSPPTQPGRRAVLYRNLDAILVYETSISQVA